MRNYHLLFTADVWKFEEEHSERSIRNFDTKSEAMEFVTDYMRTHGGSLKIHGTNGQFQEERTYPASIDPVASKG